jgi:hypothetical protein
VFQQTKLYLLQKQFHTQISAKPTKGVWGRAPKKLLKQIAEEVDGPPAIEAKVD